MESENGKLKIKIKTHELFSGEKPVGHELPGTDSHCLVRHVCVLEDRCLELKGVTKATNTSRNNGGSSKTKS